MNVEFKYRSDYVSILICLFIIALLFLGSIISDVAGSNYGLAMGLSFIVVIAYFAAIIGLFSWLSAMPAKAEADESQVKFSFWRRKVTIPYSEIVSINVKNEYKSSARGGKLYYTEIITIICKDNEYCFNNVMEFDAYFFALNPEDLAMQFKYGAFRQLKEYISEQIGTEF